MPSANQPCFPDLANPFLPHGLQLVWLSPLASNPAHLNYKKDKQLLPSKAHPARRQAFLLGRQAAHQALAKLSPKFTQTAIGRSPRGLPLWPKNVNGSISHANGWAVAAVIFQKQCSAIGIDLEHDRPSISTEKLARRILSQREHSRCNTKQSSEVLGYFSAKESVFKALYPHWQIWIGFSDIEIQFTTLATTPDSNWKQLKWQAQGKLHQPVSGHGTLHQHESWIFSLCWISPHPQSPPLEPLTNKEL